MQHCVLFIRSYGQFLGLRMSSVPNSIFNCNLYLNWNFYSWTSFSILLKMWVAFSFQLMNCWKQAVYQKPAASMIHKNIVGLQWFSSRDNAICKCGLSARTHRVHQETYCCLSVTNDFQSFGPFIIERWSILLRSYG